MALITRYIGNERGAIVITGNTLGLSRLKQTQSPGTDNAINQFITTNSTLPTPSEWLGIADAKNGENITFQWNQNSSSAVLNMLPDYSVLYAELIWGGLSVSAGTPNTVNVTQYINNPITFSTPGGTFLVEPDPTTAQESVSVNGTFYSRSQNVTEIIAQAGSGTYTVGGVPSAINLQERDTINHAGWSLIVAYSNASLPPRNMVIYVGEEYIGNGATTDLTITGFLTPASGKISARFCVSAQEGDAVYPGDQILFGESEASLAPLSGPNNPSNNFFASQINIGDPNNANVGAVDVTGTFGERNANALTGENIVAGRQGWDITNVDGSSLLRNDQSTAMIRMTSVGDIYVLNALGIQLDTIYIDSNKSVDKTEADLSDTLTYSVELTNDSGTEQTVTFIDPAPQGTTYVADSLTVSISYTGDLENGVVVTIQPNEIVLITWQVMIDNTIPASNTIENTGQVITAGVPPKNTNTVTTTINTADKSITKAADPETFIPGQRVEYTITVNNAGPNTAEDVIVTDAIPDVIEDPEYSLNGGTNWYPWIGSLGLGMLEVNESITFLVRGVLTSGITGPVVNEASVTSPTYDPDPSNDTVTITTPVLPSADIAVVKTGPASALAGNRINYMVEITNNGPSTAYDVQVEDTFLDTIYTNVQYSTDGLTWTAWASPFVIDTMESGESLDLRLRGTILPNVNQTITNSVEVSAATYDPDLMNNSDSVDTTVNALADVSIQKTQSTNTPAQNDILVYTVVVSNLGPSNALNVELTDVMPPLDLNNQQYNFESPNGPWIDVSDGIYPIGTLAPGESYTVYLQGEVLLDNAVIRNTANVTADTPDPNMSNNESTTQTLAQNTVLTVTKSAEPNPVTAGQTIVYTIVVFNTSNTVSAYNVILTDVLPAVIEEQEYSLDNGNTWNSWNNVLNLDIIAPNTSVTVMFQGIVSSSAAGTLENVVTVTSSNADPVTDNETTVVISEADIYVDKIGFPQPVTAGQTLLYLMLVGNNGPSDAQEVTMLDTLAKEILNPMISINGSAFTEFTEPYEITIGTITKGQRPVRVRVRGTLDPGTISDITNVVRVSTQTAETITTNNTAEFTHTVLSSADLKVSKDVDKSPVMAGDQMVYTINVTNAGISDAQDVTIFDELDPRLNDPQYATLITGPWTDWTDSVNIGSLASGATYTIYIRGTLESSAVGTVINTVTVKTTTPEPNPEDSTDTVITPIIQSADVSLVKVALFNPVIAGELIMYKEIVTNNGPSDAVGVRLIDIVKTNITGIQYSLDNGATWLDYTATILLGTIIAGDSVEILIKGILDEGTVADQENTAVVRATTPDPDPTNNISSAVVTVTPQADLAVKKTGIQHPPEVGEYLTHTIVITNHGPSTAYQATLTDVVPDGMDDPECSYDLGGTWEPWTGSITTPVIPSKTTATVLIRGVINASVLGNALENTAVVGSPTPDPDMSNNSSSFITTPNDISVGLITIDLEIVKTASQDTVMVNDVINYTIQVTNLGIQEAQNVVITEQIPDNLSTVQYSDNGGASWEDWTDSYVVGTLGGGETRTILVRGTVTESSINSVINVAIVSTSSNDTNLTNNVSITVTPIGGADPVQQCNDLYVYQNTRETCVCPNQPIEFWAVIVNQGMTPIDNVSMITKSSQSLTKLQFSVDYGANWYDWSQYYTFQQFEPMSYVVILFRGIVVNCRESFVYNRIQLIQSTTGCENWYSELWIPN